MGPFRKARKKFQKQIGDTFQRLGIRLPMLKIYQQMIVCLVGLILLLLVVSYWMYAINQTALKKELTKFTEHTAVSIYKELHGQIRAESLESFAIGRVLSYQITQNLKKGVTFQGLNPVGAAGAPVVGDKVTQPTRTSPANSPAKALANASSTTPPLVSKPLTQQALQQMYAPVGSALQTTLALFPSTEAMAVYRPDGQKITHTLNPSAANGTLPAELKFPEHVPTQALSQPFYELIGTPASVEGEAGHNLARTYLRIWLPMSSVIGVSATGALKPEQQVGVIAIVKPFPVLSTILEDYSESFYDALYIVDAEGWVLAGPETSVLETTVGLSSQFSQLNEKEKNFFKGLRPGVVRQYEDPLHPALRTKASLNKTPASLEDEDDAPDTLETVFIKMPETGWGVILESPYHVRQKFVKRARNQSLLIISGFFLIVFLMAFLYILSITKNFRQLFKGIKAMAQGNYQRRIRLISKLWTPHELVMLAREFNRMARKISMGWHQTQLLNEELIQRHENEAFLSRMGKALHGNLSQKGIAKETNMALSQYFDLASSVLVYHAGAFESSNLKPEHLEHQEASAFTPQPLSAASEGSPLDCPAELWVESTGAYQDVSAGLQELASHTPYERLQTHFCNQSVTDMDAPVILFQQHNPLIRAYGLGNGVWVPIHYGSIEAGFMAVFWPPEHPFSKYGVPEETVQLLSMVSDHVGVALYQAYQWQSLQAANEQLSKLDELKSNLIDTVSHELRTPLTSIKGYTSRLIRHDEELPKEIRLKSLKTIKQQADRLARLVNDLLVIPELDKATLRVYPDGVLLPPLLESCSQFIQAKEHRDIETRIHQPGGLGERHQGSAWNQMVLADPDRLEQVVLNLLDNAIKYALPDTPVLLEVFPPSFSPQPMQSMVELRVVNQCPPIPADVLPQLFEKFKRLDETLTRTTRGTGLGLYIAKSLVEAMGGTIHLSYQALSSQRSQDENPEPQAVGQFIVSVRLPAFSNQLTPEPENMIQI